MKKVFRKLHLWLSVPFGIFITLICFSGAMLVFEKEITETCRHDLYFVKEVKEKPLPIDSLMKTVSAALPDTVSVTGITISPDPERAWQISLSKPRRASVYVDQYTGEVKGRSERLAFYDVMFHMHRWMMGSSKGFGKLLVGVSTLMLVIILVTGILIWLTNRKKPLAMSLKISFTKGWTQFWHDLHVAGGIYATIFLLALALTGLTWSFPWYRTGFYAMFGIESNGGGGFHGGSERGSRGDGERGGDRGQRGERTEGRRGGRSDGERKGRGGKPGSALADAQNVNKTYSILPNDSIAAAGEQPETPISAAWQSVYEKLVNDNPGYRQITLSDRSASVVPEGRRSLRAGDKFDFDPQTGEITGSKPYSEQDKSGKVRGGVYMVHVGSWGGMLTRILTFLSALLGATLPLTGYYLWILKMRNKRRNKKNKTNNNNN